MPLSISICFKLPKNKPNIILILFRIKNTITDTNFSVSNYFAVLARFKDIPNKKVAAMALVLMLKTPGNVKYGF
jgi:hypothetical protein